MFLSPRRQCRHVQRKYGNTGGAYVLISGLTEGTTCSDERKQARATAGVQISSVAEA